MAAKKLGDLVKEARTAKKLSQAALADMVDGLSASDVGKIERNEKAPTQAVIKEIAKALGVTQKSLLDAPVSAAAKKAAASSSSSQAKKTSSSASSSSSGKKTSSSSSGSSNKKTSSGSSGSSNKKTSSGSSSSSNKKTSSGSSDQLKLSSTETKLVKAYRKADATTKKAAMGLLEGTASLADIAGSLLLGKVENSSSSSASSALENLGDLFSGALSSLGKK
ncbi:MAG: helix-turn-helix transcriptional regulator [Lachnospiraceae bacterium]|nr:helix-turn-helix transcriptional regulator [Lachnospiraceae bacterium]